MHNSWLKSSSSGLPSTAKTTTTPATLSGEESSQHRHFASSSTSSSPLPKLDPASPLVMTREERSNSTTKPTAATNFTYAPRGPVRFEDFLEADTNHDGRVTSAEWEAYLKKMREVDSDPRFTGLMVHLPISVLDAHRILESSGLSVSLNGLNYSVTLTPQGQTIDLIKKKELELKRVDEELESLGARKAPLDAEAAVHTRRVMGGFYLVAVASSCFLRLTRSRLCK